MWMTIMLLIYLMILGRKDWIDRKIPVFWLCAGTILAVGMGICRCIRREFMWWELLAGAVPGLLLLIVAQQSGKAGYADGIVMTQLGICLGYQENTMLFCCSMLLTAVVSMFLLIQQKVRKNTKMPYLTFLAVSFLALQVFGGGNPG